MMMGHSNWPFIINLGNSIVGVSVLAMPYCFKQCGIVLGTVLLLGSAWLTQISCRLLMKAAVASKKRSYEFLALHTFGAAGKLAVEVSIIGLLIGTCVAFHVIIGDLGPNIVSKMTGLQNTPQLRTSLMVFLGLCVALPLGLLRNIESLSNVSAISIGFYTVFVADIFFTALPNLWSGVWVSKVEIWRLEGVFQCLPIFALAFACQTQLFVMYDALPEPSLSMMNNIVNSAVWMCTAMYLMVGFFGYVAFCDYKIGGDVLLNLKPTIFTESIKLGFTLSVALSFPLIIFPMRASINTLMCSQTPNPRSAHENLSGASIIPPLRFKAITISVVIGTLIIGIMLPNVEFVLGLTGATMGTMISFIFPAIMFISVMSSSKGDSKSIAQMVLFIGVTTLLASTYTTLTSHDKSEVKQQLQAIVKQQELPIVPSVVAKEMNVLDKPELKVPLAAIADDKEGVKHKLEEHPKDDRENKEAADGKRREPPIPDAPNEKEEKNKEAAEKKGEGDQVKQKENDKIETKKVKIASDDSENAKAKVDAENKMKEAEIKQKDLLSKLEMQQQQQQQLIKEQKELIAQLKQHKNDAHPDKVQVQEPRVAGQQQENPTDKQLKAVQGSKDGSLPKQSPNDAVRLGPGPGPGPGPGSEGKNKLPNPVTLKHQPAAHMAGNQQQAAEQQGQGQAAGQQGQGQAAGQQGQGQVAGQQGQGQAAGNKKQSVVIQQKAHSIGVTVDKYNVNGKSLQQGSQRQQHTDTDRHHNVQKRSIDINNVKSQNKVDKIIKGVEPEPSTNEKDKNSIKKVEDRKIHEQKLDKNAMNHKNQKTLDRSEVERSDMRKLDSVERSDMRK